MVITPFLLSVFVYETNATFSVSSELLVEQLVRPLAGCFTAGCFLITNWTSSHLSDETTATVAGWNAAGLDCRPELQARRLLKPCFVTPTFQRKGTGPQSRPCRSDKYLTNPLELNIDSASYFVVSYYY